jgi:hypothetical protein
VKYGALPAQPIEQLGDFQLVDFVDGDVAHGLQQTLRPHGPGHGLNAADAPVEWELEPVHQTRRPLGERFGALHDQSARRNVDDPALVAKAIQMLNGEQIHLPSQAETTFHGLLPARLQNDFVPQEESWLDRERAAKFAAN